MQTKLQTRLFIVGTGLALVAGATSCGNPKVSWGCSRQVVVNINSSKQASEERHLTAPHVAQGGLAVRTSFGSIALMADPGLTNVVIIAKVQAGGATIEEAKTNLSRIEVKTQRRSDQVFEIWAEAPKEPQISWGCSFEVRVPEASGINARTANGRISLHGLGGTADLESSFGDVLVTNHHGPVDARSANGAIRLERIVGKAYARTAFGQVSAREVQGPVETSTGNGNVEIVGATNAVQAATSFGAVTVRDAAESVKIKSANGSIKVERAGGDVIASISFGTVEVRETGGAADLNSLNGSITYAPAKGNERSFALTTTFGPVVVQLPASASGRIQANTSFGNISVDGTRKPHAVTGDEHQKTIVLSGSGPESRIRTANGNIRIHLE